MQSYTEESCKCFMRTNDKYVTVFMDMNYMIVMNDIIKFQNKHAKISSDFY